MPPGEWVTWLILAGRGWGKSKTGAQSVLEVVANGSASRIALVAPTAADARDVMVEGESGILASAKPWERPLYEPSKRRLTWPNGAIATTYSAEEPEALRGPQHDFAWCDELCRWKYVQDTWDMLQFGLRLGKSPRQIITTTPKPIKTLKEILADPMTIVTRGRTLDNKDNLAPAFMRKVVGKYEGTRLGRQELEAAILEDVAGALWDRNHIDLTRIKSRPPSINPVVVAVDPPVTSGEDADECGIVVAGRDQATNSLVVLGDHSSHGDTPGEWAKKVVEAYKLHQANYIVAEVNNGGELVAEVIRHVDPNLPIRMVRASRGKVTRAEPIALLYEQGRASHLGSFAQLEDQMCMFTSDFDPKVMGFSPDRVDALVWAATFCMDGAADWSVMEM